MMMIHVAGLKDMALKLVLSLKTDISQTIPSLVSTSTVILTFNKSGRPCPWFLAVAACGTKGIPQSDIGYRMNVGKLEARMFCRRLERDGLIKVTMM